MSDDTQSDSSVPRCVGFIMDGNRRWAKKNAMKTILGHKRGAEVFDDTVRFIRDKGVKHAVFYAFSSENWNRSEEEVSYLMDLFAEEIESLHRRLNDPEEPEQKVRFRFVGDLARFSEAVRERITEVEAESELYDLMTVWIALSYGGRDEIITAVNQAILNDQPVDQATFRTLLWTADLPDPDLIVRTGGQQRLSNFLTWQSAYSELIFIDTLWPDVTTTDLENVLREYATRQRNFGK